MLQIQSSYLTAKKSVLKLRFSAFRLLLYFVFNQVPCETFNAILPGDRPSSPNEYTKFPMARRAELQAALRIPRTTPQAKVPNGHRQLHFHYDSPGGLPEQFPCFPSEPSVSSAGALSAPHSLATLPLQYAHILLPPRSAGLMSCNI